LKWIKPEILLIGVEKEELHCRGLSSAFIHIPAFIGGETGTSIRKVSSRYSSIWPYSYDPPGKGLSLPRYFFKIDARRIAAISPGRGNRSGVGRRDKELIFCPGG
jgi:hypothetical protein